MEGYVIGVDGCRSGWLICRYDAFARHVNFDVLPTFRDILEREIGAGVIAIDIPTGLTDDGRARRCDSEARRMLSGARASSVFPAPARCLLAEQSYAAACSRSRSMCGKAISKQAFAIYPKIYEVDTTMNPELQRRVFEVHPEICFWGVERRPMRHSKKTLEGYAERRRLLAGLLPFSFPERRDVRQLGLGAQPDDVLDAAIAAFTADRVRLGIAVSLPSEPELDGADLGMQMVY